MIELNKVVGELEKIVESHYHGEDIDMFYADYRRRVELLTNIVNRAPLCARILDAGCAPGFALFALKLLGYDIICLDLDPEPYRSILQAYGCKVIKVVLERDVIPLVPGSIDAVIFTEVSEHLNLYYVSRTPSELNRVLRCYGLLFLTTLNIASISKETKLPLGENPLGQAHC